jgi:hypothetical protein
LKLDELTKWVQMLGGYKHYLGAYKIKHSNIIELHFVPCEVYQPLIDTCQGRN